MYFYQRRNPSPDERLRRLERRSFVEPVDPEIIYRERARAGLELCECGNIAGDRCQYQPIGWDTPCGSNICEGCGSSCEGCEKILCDTHSYVCPCGTGGCVPNTHIIDTTCWPGGLSSCDSCDQVICGSCMVVDESFYYDGIDGQEFHQRCGGEFCENCMQNHDCTSG
jgi:hypothetical protein